MMKYILTEQARINIRKRGVSIQMLEDVLESPQQIVDGDGHLMVFQSKKVWENGKVFLVRLVVDCQKDYLKVVTVYRAEKIDRYWRKDQ
ncbi:MAG: DUF4258 domain-containing protein [Candidatus Omnitrophota bacterium]